MILKLEPERLIRYSHFSPLSGKPDLAENYYTVTIELSGDRAKIHISLSQDDNLTEKSRKHSENNWVMMLASLKELLEK